MGKTKTPPKRRREETSLNNPLDMKEKKQVSNFMMPDAPESKNEKGKTSDSQNWIPCPLLLGVPAVPPPRQPQPWEVRRLNSETIADALSMGQSAITSDVPSPVMGKTVNQEQTMEDRDNDVIQGTPPELTKIRPSLSNKRKRKTHLSPSLANIQATDSPVNSAWTKKDDREIGVTMEHDPLELNASGSEVDGNEVNNASMDITLSRRIVNEYPAIMDDSLSIISSEVQSLGPEDDVGLLALADPDEGDLLDFDWSGDVNKFKGVREMFIGPSGPTFEVTGLTPLETFKTIWDTDIINHIVRETNRYAHQTQVKTALHSRMSRWKDTTEVEIWRFFTIIMLQSLVVNDVERDYWYPSNNQLKIGDFEKIMPYNRFIVLKKCLHFVDITAMPEHKSELHKVMPIIRHLNKKFSTLYQPEQNVAIDESLLQCKDRLSFTQLNATKRAKVDIKSYELCECRTGYLWRMEFYSGKGHVHVPQEATERHELGNGPDSATIVLGLMKPLFGKGHTLVMNNFYNAPLISRLLKTKHHTDTMGTLRLNRKFVPESLESKNKNNMKEGEVCFSSTKDLCVVVWKNKNVVAMLSTFHHPEVGGKKKYGYYKYKPEVVLDYNLNMGGVDHKDQMLHAFPLDRHYICWHNKLFRRLLNVSIHNALVIFNHGRTRQTELGNRQFRHKLVLEMLQKYSPEALNIQQSPLQFQASAPPTVSQLHLPAKNVKVQRCKFCHEAKKRRTTIWRCSTCNVNLCIEGCYTSYHAKYVCTENNC